MRASALFPVLGVVSALLVACGDDSTSNGSGGGGGAGGAGSSTTSTSTGGSTSTGTSAVCEDAAPRPVEVILRNDTARRLYLADFPGYDAPDLGFFEVDGNVGGCPCLKPAFCSMGSSNESGPDIGYLEPGAEIAVSWTGLLPSVADASCGHTEGCVLDVLPADGAQTLRSTAYGSVDCGGLDCECDLTVEGPCGTSSIGGSPALENEIVATATLDLPGDTTVTLSFSE